MGDMFQCQLRSPDRTLYDGEAVSVTARSPRGEFAVLAHHAPLLAELAVGPLRIRTATEELRFAFFGGTLSANANRVVILGSEIVPREEIDLEEERRRAGEAPQGKARERLELLEKVAQRDD
jgi:F-type H+-transporting ATPase subunit epsilon